LKNIKWLSFVLILSRGSWLIALYLLAYALDVEAYGAFAFNMALWLFVFKAAGIGLDVWVTHAIASRPKNFRVYVNKALILRIILVVSAFLLFGLFWLLINHYDQNFIWVFVIIGLRQVAENIRELLIGILHGLEEMQRHAKAIIPVDGLQLAVLLVSIFVLDIKSIIVISSVILLFSLIRIIALWMQLASLMSDSKQGENALTLSFKEVARRALPIGMTSILALVIGKVDVLMLGQMDTLTIVANYTFAYLFLEVIVIAFGAIRKALFPRLSNYYRLDNKKFYQLLLPSLIVTALIGIALLFVVKGFSDVIVFNFYAEKYTDARQYIQTLAYSIPVLLLATQLGSALISMQKLRIIIIIQVLAVLINIGLNIMWIPEYSGLGAIWATIISYAFTCSLYAFFVFRSAISGEKIYE